MLSTRLHRSTCKFKPNQWQTFTSQIIKRTYMKLVDGKNSFTFTSQKVHDYNTCTLPLAESPWYNCTGWLGVKHQLTYLLTPCCFPLNEPFIEVYPFFKTPFVFILLTVISKDGFQSSLTSEAHVKNLTLKQASPVLVDKCCHPCWGGRCWQRWWWTPAEHAVILLARPACAPHLNQPNPPPHPGRTDSVGTAADPPPGGWTGPATMRWHLGSPKRKESCWCWQPQETSKLKLEVGLYHVFWIKRSKRSISHAVLKRNTRFLFFFKINK